MKQAGISKQPKMAGLCKRDFCAHIWQYIHYVEDGMCVSKNYDVTVLRKKTQQIKQLLQDLEDHAEVTHVRPGAQRRR